MKADDTKYGRNWAGKASLCETCAYTGGYCLKNRKRYYDIGAGKPTVETV